MWFEENYTNMKQGELYQVTNDPKAVSTVIQFWDKGGRKAFPCIPENSIVMYLESESEDEYQFRYPIILYNGIVGTTSGFEIFNHIGTLMHLNHMRKGDLYSVLSYEWNSNGLQLWDFDGETTLCMIPENHIVMYLGIQIKNREEYPIVLYKGIIGTFSGVNHLTHIKT